MRRGLQLVVLAALTGPGVVLLGPITAAQAAGTQSAKPGVLQTAWYWQTAAEQANPPVAPPAPPPTEPSGVPKGDLGIAHTSTDNTSSKLAVVAFQVDDLKAGATVDSFKVSLTLDSAGTNVGPSPAPVVACLPTRLWPAGEGSDITNAPPTDCSSQAKPKVSGSTYTFDVTSIAQQWVGSDNLGVALINDPANTQTPFQTVFSIKSIQATMTYTPPVAAAPPPAASTPGLGGSGLGNGTGTSAGSSTGSGTTASAPSGPVNLPPSGPTTQTTTPTGQTPRVAPSTTTPATTPAALTKPDSSSPNGAFWLGALAVAVLVVVAGVVLADDAVSVPTATTTRLGRVLRDRQRALQLETPDDATTDATTTLAPRRV